MTILYKAPNPHGGQYEIQLKPIYADKFGNTWLEYINDLQFPYTRKLLATRYLLGAGIGLSLKEVADITKQTLEAHSKKQELLVAEKLISLLEKVEYADSEDSMLNFACVHFLLNGEHAEYADSEFAVKKKEILEKDDAARDFFLSELKSKVKELRELSKSGFQSFMTAQKQSGQSRPKALGYKLPS